MSDRKSPTRLLLIPLLVVGVYFTLALVPVVIGRAGGEVFPFYHFNLYRKAFTTSTIYVLRGANLKLPNAEINLHRGAKARHNLQDFYTSAVENNRPDTVSSFVAESVLGYAALPGTYLLFAEERDYLLPEANQGNSASTVDTIIILQEL